MFIKLKQMLLQLLFFNNVGLIGADISIDHSLILAKFRLTLRRTQKYQATKSQRISIQFVQDETTQNLYRSWLKQRINNNGITEEDNVEIAWQKK